MLFKLFNAINQLLTTIINCEYYGDDEYCDVGTVAFT